jgi:membrane protease YdiL (CAAX protease family)
VAAGYLVVLAVPAARSAIAGSGAGRSEALRRAFVTIPLTTVIPEEFAFRGVLLGILGADRRSAIVTSLVFGIWHVLPALGDGPANDTVGAVIGEGHRGVAVRAVGTVLVTSVGGLMMAASRLRSRSLLAPILMHWAVNGIGELVSAHR